jgi:hypothetical protein
MGKIDTHGHDDADAEATEPLYDPSKPAASEQEPAPGEMVRAQTPAEVEAQEINAVPEDAQIAEVDLPADVADEFDDDELADEDDA